MFSDWSIDKSKQGWGQAYKQYQVDTESKAGGP
ncbi:hypothetical protein HBHAL_4366 [Halobacillus halophilus DSM 2266]|uniref:Uncharacterized protein n=1 Tax=Halobacillus halophilus (strain ATCC 35676 / DSM 2266 / JCM 20832 / KCTC 3685 / LMG 17431 / NBRC 102448 / NCIMB 2269) TaxID=866895 RepID=I0JRD7_HALH3|nr:hypothetical protein HBHAL_4366 [Halobacillus halophilus DSM 2266]